MEIGQQDYLMDVYIHRSVGPGQADVICPKKNYGKPCPICEQADKYKQDGKQKEFGQLKPKRMGFYNVEDIRDPDKGLQVLAVSHYLFEKELIDEARAESDNGDILNFPAIEDGKVVVFRAASASFEGHDYFEFKSFQFLDREDELEDDLVEAAISFDEIMKVLSYDDIEKVLWGEDEDDEDEDEDEEPPPKKRKKKPVPVEDEDEDDEEEDEPELPKKRKKKPAPVEEDEEDEVEDAPSPKKKAPAKKKKPAEDDDDNPCPSGYQYGKDCDTKDECEECDKWGACLKEKNKSKK